MENTQVKSNEEEIKNLFYFLGGEEMIHNKDALKASNVIYGLENYGLPLPIESIRILKNELEKKSKIKEGYITLDDFKSLWLANVDSKVQNKDLTNHMYHLMLEFLEEREENKFDKYNKPNYELKVDENQLASLLESLGILEDTPEENQSEIIRDHRSKKKIENKNRAVAKEMIKSLALNGHDVTINDFEFLI